VEKQEKKESPFLTAADIYGTKRKAHVANCLIGIVNCTATVNVNERTEAERSRHKLWLCVPKNRDGAIFKFKQILNTHSGKLEDDDSEDPDDVTAKKTDELLKEVEAEEEEKERKKKESIPETVREKKKTNDDEIAKITEKAKKVADSDSLEVKQNKKTNASDAFK
jgi:hypothetical protein